MFCDALLYLAGGVVNLREVKAEVAKYNVQLDNLCQASTLFQPPGVTAPARFSSFKAP